MTEKTNYTTNSNINLQVIGAVGMPKKSCHVHELVETTNKRGIPPKVKELIEGYFKQSK